MENITLGYTLAKPVVTQAQCDAYTAMADAVVAHNTACGVGNMLWRIEDKEHCYAIAEDGIVQPPTAEELAAQEEARKKQQQREKLPETVAALQAAQADADALNVDQAYRLTLLELNVSDTDDTENT